MVSITHAQSHDVHILAELLDEVNHFYGAPTTEPPGSQLRQINDALFSNAPAGYALLAWEDDSPVGFASYSYLWPAVGLTRSLYLKELYVRESHRREGIGDQLMQALIEVARDNHCSRIEWTTDDDNDTAQRFYEKLGFEKHLSKIFYRLETASSAEPPA
jgi:GNAT superfamily N-acetyltransferase